MGGLGHCTVNGTLDDSRFNQPMPWIGLYVVAASAACAIAMAIDAFHGFRYRKFWFPSKFFALNSTTLTLIGVAVKLSVDLNTSMPRAHDQLAKLSSTAFICTAIGNSMPSVLDRTCCRTVSDGGFVCNHGFVISSYTCNPQFVTGRLATCTASGAFCLLSALTLAEAMLRSYLMPSCFTFCKGDSDYKWSSMLILVTQAIAVLGGTIAPASRWFIAIKFMCPKAAKRAHPHGFSSVENYWVKILHRFKESTLELRLCGLCGRRLLYRLLYNARNRTFDFCIQLQKGMVILSKSIRFLSVMIVSQLLVVHRCFKKLVKLVTCSDANLNSEMVSDSHTSSKLDLSRYVLHLEGDEALIDMMMEFDRDTTGHWLRMGRMQQPKHLMQLLERLNPLRDFEGVQNFDNKQIPSLDCEEPPNNWALPGEYQESSRSCMAGSRPPSQVAKRGSS